MQVHGVRRMIVHGHITWFVVAAALLVFAVFAAAPAYASDRQAGGTQTAPAAAPMPQQSSTPPVAAEPVHLELHPLGIGIAVLFLILMINLFLWMFRVPPLLPYEVVKARQSVSALHRILVPVGEDVASERAVELASRLGVAQKAEIILAYVFEVPYSLSLDAQVPTEDAKAEHALSTARFIVEQHGLPVRAKILASRQVWGGILRLAHEEAVDAIVMSTGRVRSGTIDSLSRTAEEVIRRSEVEVILDKAPVWVAPVRPAAA
jgi:nucleotide-binding universal stress UspA family protein